MGAAGSTRKEILIGWTDNTGVNAIPHIPSAKCIPQLIFWILASLAGFSMLIFHTVVITNQYLEYETITNVANIINRTLDFPQVTFCSANPLKRKSDGITLLTELLYAEERVQSKDYGTVKISDASGFVEDYEEDSYSDSNTGGPSYEEVPVDDANTETKKNSNTNEDPFGGGYDVYETFRRKRSFTDTDSDTDTLENPSYPTDPGAQPGSNSNAGEESVTSSGDGAQIDFEFAATSQSGDEFNSGDATQSSETGTSRQISATTLNAQTQTESSPNQNSATTIGIQQNAGTSAAIANAQEANSIVDANGFDTAEETGTHTADNSDGNPIGDTGSNGISPIDAVSETGVSGADSGINSGTTSAGQDSDVSSPAEDSAANTVGGTDNPITDNGVGNNLVVDFDTNTDDTNEDGNPFDANFPTSGGTDNEDSPFGVTAGVGVTSNPGSATGNEPGSNVIGGGSITDGPNLIVENGETNVDPFDFNNGDGKTNNEDWHSVGNDQSSNNSSSNADNSDSSDQNDGDPNGGDEKSPTPDQTADIDAGPSSGSGSDAESSSHDEYTAGMENVEKYMDLLKKSIVNDFSDLGSVLRFKKRDFLENGGFSLDDLLVECSWDALADCPYNYFQTVSRSYGLCYTFNSPFKHTPYGYERQLNATKLRSNQFGSSFGLQMTFNIHKKEYIGILAPNYSMRISFSNFGSFPTASSHGLLIPPGIRTSIVLRRRISHRLRAPYRSSCISEFPESLRDYLVIPDQEYTLQHCVLACRDRHIVNNCGCTENLNLNLTKLNTDRCDPLDSYIIENEAKLIATCLSEVSRGLAKERDDENYLSCEECAPGCVSDDIHYHTYQTIWPTDPMINFMRIRENWAALLNKAEENTMSRKSESSFNYAEYIDGEPNDKNDPWNIDADKSKFSKYKWIRHNFARLHVYFVDDSYDLIEEKEAKTVITLIADWGGIAGLYLGVSLISTFEVLELTYLLVATTFFPGVSCSANEPVKKDDLYADDDMKSPPEIAETDSIPVHAMY